MRRYKYEKVIDYIRDNYIDNPDYTDGKLPSEPELAKEMKVSRFPVNQAYNILLEKGDISKVSGLGTFIRGFEPKDYAFKRASLKKAGFLCETDKLSPQLQAGLHDELLLHGITLTNIISSDVYSESNILSRIKELDLQCLFVVPRLHFGTGENSALGFVNKLAGQGVMPIIVERYLKGFKGMQVLVDNAGGTAMATEWLLNDGREKIAYIGKDDYVVGQERYRGYCNALRDNDLEPDESLIALDRSNGQFQNVWESFVESGMDRIMKAHPDCKSFVTFGFELAFRVYQYLKRHGLFTEDVKIAGYDNFPHFNDEFRECYICLERSLYQIGRDAGALMAEYISSAEQNKYVVKRILPEMHFSKKDFFINAL
jgi:DNA-binding LacI/PurR family transcriptional regulator